MNPSLSRRAAPGLLATALVAIVASPIAASDPVERLLARPVSPGTLAALTAHASDARVERRWRESLTNADGEIRATAARLLLAGGWTSSLPSLLDALDREQDEHDNLSRLLLTSGRIEEADRESLEAVRVLRAAAGPKDPHLAGALNNRALLLLERGLFDEAERHSLEALAMFRELLGDGHPQLAPFEEDLEEIRRRKKSATGDRADPPGHR